MVCLRKNRGSLRTLSDQILTNVMIEAADMTELEKLEAGLEYCYDDAEVSARKENAIIQCRKYNAIDDTESEGFY